MWCSYEDGVPADTIHVDARGRLYVIQMNVAILRDEINHIIFGTYLRETEREKKRKGYYKYARIQSIRIC